MSFRLIVVIIAGSSNGRMRLSESRHLGSNPSPAVCHCVPNYTIRPSSNIFPTPTLTLSPARRLAGSPPRTAAPSPCRTSFVFNSRGGLLGMYGAAGRGFYSFPIQGLAFLTRVCYPSTMSKPSPNETSKDRFKRLATQRTNNILQKLKVLGNCSNRSVYDYNEEDISKIFSEIERRVKETKAKFHYPKRKAFKL